MGILEKAVPAIVICTRDRNRATAFYRDALGLRLTEENEMAAVFQLGDATLRVSTVPDWTPHGHTILGFKVADVPETVRALKQKGVEFERFAHVRQDELGVCTLPGGKGCVAWFKDSAGNILSVTDA